MIAILNKIKGVFGNVRTIKKEQYSTEELRQMGKCVEIWDLLREEQCPRCTAKKSIMIGPHGGMAVNVKCSECDAIFWLTPCREIGAEFMD